MNAHRAIAILSDETTVRRLGRYWVASDGRRMPVVAGAATDETDATDEVVIDLPEDLTTLGDPELATAETTLVEQFDALHDAGSRDVEKMTKLAQAIKLVRAEGTRRTEQAAADQAAIDALANDVHASDEPGDDDGGDDPGDGDAPADGGDGEGADAKDGDKVAVTASAKPQTKVSASQTARRSARPAVAKTRPEVTIVAAADLPGIPVGGPMDPLKVAKAMHDKARLLGTRSPRVPIAQFELANQFEVTKGMSDEAAFDVVTAAADPARLDLTTLTASGGWCTPSEQVYDLFELPLDTGVFSLPSVTVRRGGLNLPDYVGFDAADGALWTWTEGQDEGVTESVTNKALTSNVATITVGAHAYTVGSSVLVNISDPVFDGEHVITAIDATSFSFAKTHANVTSAAAEGTVTAQKPTLRIPCPGWTEYRLLEEGLSLTHGNLTDRAFPENTRRFVALAMAAHARRIGMAHLNAIASATHATSATITAVAGTDAYGNLMSAIDLSVQSYRSQHHLSDSVILEAAFPAWVLAAIRSNLAMRAGVDLLSVTDQQIASHFATRKVKPQFVLDYQPLETGTADVTPVVVWPATVQFVLWAAGGFIEGNGGVIDLGVQRDSTLNKTNDFTAAWTEQAVFTARKGPKARKVTATLGVTGATGYQPA